MSWRRLPIQLQQIIAANQQKSLKPVTKLTRPTSLPIQQYTARARTPIANGYGTAPVTGVTSLLVQAWGGGGGGAGNASTDASGGSGGGGGEFAAEALLAVTPGKTYTVVVGAAGAAGSGDANGGAGGSSTFAGDSVTVIAHGGAGGATNGGAGGAGGTGSSNTTHFTGGAGGVGAAFPLITRGNLSALFTSASNGGNVTWASNPTAGQTVLVAIFTSVGETVSSCIDNGVTPTTFTQDVSLTNSAGQHMYIYRGTNITLPATGSYVVTITAAGGTTVAAGGVAYSSVAAGAPTATNNGSAATGTAITTNAVTGARAGALCFAVFTNHATASETISAAGGGFGNQFTQTNGAAFAPGAIADQIVAGGPTAETCTWTTGTSASWVAAVAVYDAAVSPGSGGGGSSAGTAAIGNAGSAPTGGVAPTGGGAGGNGTAVTGSGSAGSAPGGGGGAAYSTSGTVSGSAGAAGQVSVTSQGITTTFSTAGSHTYTVPTPSATVQVGPQGLGTVWYPQSAAIGTTTGAADASTCQLYIGPLSQLQLISGTSYAGGGDSIGLGVPPITPGYYIVAVWSGAHLGDTASLAVYGSQDAIVRPAN